MSLLEKLFGDDKATAQQSPSAPHLIDEASRIADESFRLTLGVTSTDTEAGARLVSAIDNALAVSPGNADLLVAKYAALTFSYHDAGAPQLALQRALAVSPNHFDGCMLRDHEDSWHNLFHFPSWSEGRVTLHPVMVELLSMGQALQIVRDGMSLGLAVVNPGPSNGFPTNIRRSGWKIIWSKTPHGPIAIHYTLLDVDGQVYRQEAVTPHIADEKKPTVRSGYWILRRLPHLKSCFVVYADGSKVLHNTKHQFPDSLRSVITAMDRDLEASGPVPSALSCQAAEQWYVQNVDLDSIGF